MAARMVHTPWPCARGPRGPSLAMLNMTAQPTDQAEESERPARDRGRGGSLFDPRPALGAPE
jgi:hypothetical protein